MGKTNKTKRHDRKSKKVKKDRNREKRKESRKLKKPKDDNKNTTKASKESRQCHNNLEDSFAIPVELMNNKSYAPETSKEYEQRQNKVRRELDPISGRLRLIKGDGEVLEEIVSRERHAAINKIASKNDGQYFCDNTVNKLRKS